MARTCSICSHPLRKEVDAALSETGVVIARVASDFAVSPDALKRHRANHLLPERREALSNDPELASVDPLGEMRTLYHRMIGFLGRAEEADNWPAVRSFHAEARKDLELLAKLLGELDERPQVNVVLIAPQALTVIAKALDPYPEARKAVVEALEPLEAAAGTP